MVSTFLLQSTDAHAWIESLILRRTHNRNIKTITFIIVLNWINIIDAIATFKIISVISWLSASLVKETGIIEEKHQSDKVYNKVVVENTSQWRTTKVTNFVVITIRSFHPFMTYHRVCNSSNTKGATCGAWTAYPSGAPDFSTTLTSLSGELTMFN